MMPHLRSILCDKPILKMTTKVTNALNIFDGYLLNVRNRAVSMSMYAVNSEDDGDNKDVADDASYRRCFLLQCC